MNRLFVPLKTEFFNHFKGEKEWELRGINRQFNEDTVFEGRKVELRRGYSTNDSIWGEITDVETFQSVEKITEEIDHEKISPGKSLDEFRNEAKVLLSKYEEFIAFKIYLEDTKND